MPGVDDKNYSVSGSWRSPLPGRRRWQGTAPSARQDLDQDMAGRNRRWQGQRRQSRTEIVHGQTKLANMRWQAITVTSHMLDGMHSSPKLGKEDEGNEKKTMRGRHGSEFNRDRLQCDVQPPSPAVLI
jgi:hypothetical protein